MALDTDVIILDEVTSALAYDTEVLVKNAIEQITKGKIAILVAHRLFTIEDCNTIVVMKEGKIVEQGSKEMLMNHKREFYKLIHSL